MRINKYPFFLWLTQKRDDLKLDLQNQRIYSDELGSSSIKAVPVYWIILMKYVPVAIFPYFFLFPQNQKDLAIASISLFFVGLFFLVKNNFFLIKILLLSISILSILSIFFVSNIAIDISTALTYFCQFSLVVAIFYDIFIIKGYKNWYYLESFKNEVNIQFSQKKERKFFKKKIETGANLSSKFAVKGYFLRISNEAV